MAKYSDGVTEPEVGDIVKCVKPKLSECYDLNVDSTYKVAYVFGEYIALDGLVGHNVYSHRFKLIKRTGAAPSPEPEQPAVNNEQSPPLVVWPEETAKLTWPQLHDNTAFVFDMVGCRDVPHLRVVGGYASFRTNESGAMDVHNGNKSYPVRLLKITRPPSCEVI